MANVNLVAMVTTDCALFFRGWWLRIRVSPRDEWPFFFSFFFFGFHFGPSVSLSPHFHRRSPLRCFSSAGAVFSFVRPIGHGIRKKNGKKMAPANGSGPRRPWRRAPETKTKRHQTGHRETNETRNAPSDRVPSEFYDYANEPRDTPSLKRERARGWVGGWWNRTRRHRRDHLGRRLRSHEDCMQIACKLHANDRVAG